MSSRNARAYPERRFLVFDGDGSLVATFATWDAAHAWSHLRAAEPLTHLPVSIEDGSRSQSDRRTWVVEPGTCSLTLWVRHAEYPVCGLPELGAGAGASGRLADG